VGPSISWCFIDSRDSSEGARGLGTEGAVEEEWGLGFGDVEKKRRPGWRRMNGSQP
jgi:hypothetical protein